MATKNNRALLAHEKKSAERRRKRSLPIKADEPIADVTVAASAPDRLDEMDRKLDILIEIVGRFGRDANAHAAAAARLNMALKTMIYSLTTDAERQADK